MNYNAHIENTIEYIEQNLINKIELKELADKAFLSKYYFHRIFHSIVGEPVAEYIRKRRLIAAANELLYTNEKIIDIALKYQFSSQESFSKAFKRFYKISPREFRNNQCNVILINSRNKTTNQLSMAA